VASIQCCRVKADKVTGRYTGRSYEHSLLKNIGACMSEIGGSQVLNERRGNFDTKPRDFNLGTNHVDTDNGN
jgi:hypothetical protein